MTTSCARLMCIALLVTIISACTSEGSETVDTVVRSQPIPQNTAPEIWGAPNASVLVGNVYAFTPSAQDSDGDSLVFSIINRPDWASFDTTTGKLRGQPGDGDVGVYENIRISASDGQATASLPAFSIEVAQIALGSMTLSWTPPTRNTDGTPLTDLAGYFLYYGTASGTYTEEIRIDNPGVSSYVVEDLPPATYFAAVTAFSAADIESAYSVEASKTITGL